MMALNSSYPLHQEILCMQLHKVYRMSIEFPKRQVDVQATKVVGDVVTMTTQCSVSSS
jgi:hypothetical protein